MKRLDVSDPKVFDKWRELYSELTHEENIQFGYDMEKAYPHQASFNPAPIETVLAGLNRPRVFEVGGWKGELALHMFKKELVSEWTNFDMCKAAVEKTLPELKDYKYYPIFPTSFDWFGREFTKPLCDIAISCHTIEHLTDSDLKKLITYLSITPKVLFEAPIGEGPSDWTGYQGTHILKMGWTEIDKAMAVHKYRPTKLTDWMRLYEQ